MKSFESLCTEAAAIVEERVKLESPSIRDTPSRRFAVFQGELTVLLVREGITVDTEEVREAAEKYVFGPKEAATEPASSPETATKTAKSGEK